MFSVLEQVHHAEDQCCNQPYSGPARPDRLERVNNNSTVYPTALHVFDLSRISIRPVYSRLEVNKLLPDNDDLDCCILKQKWYS